ncbi:MAG: hypothetical protein ACRDRL_22785 [Sciscionella sp.]
MPQPIRRVVSHTVVNPVVRPEVAGLLNCGVMAGLGGATRWGVHRPPSR